MYVGVDSQLAHTSNLIGRLHDEQRERLSQGAVEQGDGRLMLPGPSEEEMRIASDLRAGLVQLTAQVGGSVIMVIYEERMVAFELNWGNVAL